MQVKMKLKYNEFQTLHVHMSFKVFRKITKFS